MIDAKRKFCCIFCSAAITDYAFAEKYNFRNAFVIAADGGLFHTEKLNVVPDVAIGDFDTHFPPSSDVLTICCPRNKERTDGQLAVDYAIKKKFDNITIFGALGGRLDHELGNIFMLKSIYEAGILGRIVDEKNEIYLTQATIILQKDDKKYLSIIPLCETVIVSLYGVLYAAENCVLKQWQNFGISNEIVSNVCKISVSEGLVLVIKSKD